MKHKSRRNTLAVFCFLGLLFLLDSVIFRYAIWNIPNESAWNTHHFHNFLYETERIRSTPKEKPRVFIVGSSIAYYSMDQALLREELEAKLGKSVDVEYFSYAGKSPLYLYLFLDQLWQLEPDLVVYPLNFIDYRLHRAYVLDPNSNLSNIDEELLLKDAIAQWEAPQAKYIFPWETLREMWEYLDWDRRGQLFIAGLFKFYGLKEIYREPLSEVANHRFGRNSSYHGYAGVQIPERVNSLGWTGKKFSFRVTEKIRREGFWIEVVPEILKNGSLKVSAIYRNPDESGSEVSEQGQKWEFPESGWKKISLPQKWQKDGWVEVELSSVWYAYEADGFLKDYHRDPMGVRLTQTFGLETPKKNHQYIREERTEDLRYIGMSDDDYSEYFFFRLLQDLHLRPGILYLVHLAESKKKLNEEKFRPLLHFAYLAKIADAFREKNVPLILINNPENPLSLGWYEDSAWYKGHIEFLRGLEGGSVRFEDLRSALPMQDFSDYHHFTYRGMVKMTGQYARKILDFSAL